MIELIRIRKECPEIGAGEWQILPTRSRQVLGGGCIRSKERSRSV